MESAEWIKYRTTSDITFAGDLTLHYFVMTNVPNFCQAYQDTIADTFPVFESYKAIREQYQDADDLQNPALCTATVNYYNALADATDELMQPGAFYLNSSLGLTSEPDGGGLILEEGAPAAGAYNMTDSPLAEDGDFFRLFARFYTENRYRVMADSIDCSDPNWGQVYDFLGYREYAGEVLQDGTSGSMAVTTISGDETKVTHSNVLAVARDRSSATTVNSDADYLLCEITTQEYFLKIFDR